MDQGLLVIPFVVTLLVIALWDARVLLGIWVFLWIGMPTLRSRFGPVSVYWCDVSAIVTALACMRWPGNDVSRHLGRWYAVLFVVHCVGIITSLARYQAILEPGYAVLRYSVAFLPLMILPRVARDPDAMRWFWRGVVAAGLWMALVAVIQSQWRDVALQFETFLYGHRSRGSGSFAYRERALLFSERIRVHGMYGVSTSFAGATTMAGVLLFFRMNREGLGWLGRAALLGAAAAMLLTISRHGLLAWGVLLLPVMLRRPGRGSILPLIMIGIVTVLGAREFWAERLSRGGIEEDHNLSSRLVDRPLELLERVSEEPSILVGGVGLGISHITRGGEDGPSMDGFVSNGFALYLFHLGSAALIAVVTLLASGFKTALSLDSNVRAAALGGLGAAVVIIASDNYAFLHTSFPFMWSALLALIFDCADTSEMVDEASSEEEGFGPSVYGLNASSAGPAASGQFSDL